MKAPQPEIEVHAASAEELELTRELLREYQRAIGVDLCFQSFDQELASLPGAYAPPSGRLLVASVDGAVAGCVALKRLGDGVCEMKRLFVRPAFAGKGVGRTLTTAIIEEARAIGYEAMRLDTLPSMTSAQALYQSLGFRPITAYTFNPVPGTVYLELPLRP